MSQAEHVGRFVDEDLTASSKQDFFVVASAFLAVEDWIVSGEAINSNAAAQHGLTKDKIP